MSPLPALHSKHDVIKLSIDVSPPFDAGSLWSITSLAPSWGVLPQYWQVKLSLFNILKRIFKLAHRLLITFLLRLRLTGAMLACLRAFDHDPNRCSYTDVLGKPFKSLIFQYVIGCATTAASCSFSIKYSVEREKVPLGFPNLLAIIKIITRAINKGKYYFVPFFYCPQRGIQWIGIYRNCHRRDTRKQGNSP